MKIGVVIPVLNEIDIEDCYNKVKEGLSGTEFNIIFALNNKLNYLFTKIRSTFLENSSISAFMVDRNISEQKLIALAMMECESYDATIIYSGKEEINVDVLKAFLTSWRAGNKIVYLQKEYFGIKKLFLGIKRAIYKFGIKLLGIFKDECAQVNIQLLDNDVVKTINAIPTKNTQLRVLDSFVGYHTDVIKIQLDPRQNNYKDTTELNKPATISLIVSLMSMILSIGCITTTILALILKWKFSFIAHFGCWLGFIVFAILSLIYNTKKQLNQRIGVVFDDFEIKDLKNKIEKYNLSKK